MDIGIYKIRNMTDGKFYIGSTVDSFSNRWTHHKGRLRANQHCNPKLQNAWNKYGERSFTFEILETCVAGQCIEREQYYLDSLKPSYNICPTAGNRTGYRHSCATKKKISKSSRGFKKSQAHREALSRAKKGKKLSPEHQAKLTPQRCGSRNGRAVIDERQAKKIKDLLETGISQQKIADQFGIYQTLVSRIARGVSWSHV